MKSDPIDNNFAAAVRAQNTEALCHGLAGENLARVSISEQVSGRIVAMIKSGNLKSGDKLPTEQQMCLALGISRPPLREALKALTLIGVLKSRQGGRYQVTDLKPSRLVTPFNLLMSVAEHDLQVQFEARTVIELELVRFCTERATDEQRLRILALARVFAFTILSIIKRLTQVRTIQFYQPCQKVFTTSLSMRVDWQVPIPE